MRSSPHFFWIALLCGVLLCPSAAAQTGDGYDASWYDPAAPHLKINVTRDGVYRVSASALQGALPDGTRLSDIDPQTLRLLENGREIPLEVRTGANGTLDPSDTVAFVGRRNRGADEDWAYEGADAPSSRARSLYSDTTHYWMTWGGADGLRYDEGTASTAPASTAPATTALRDTVRSEEDRHYYFGRSGQTGNPLYTRSEGYYWRRFRHNDTAPIADTYVLPVGRRTATDDSLTLRLRFDAATNSCHRVEVEGELQDPEGGQAFESLTTVRWRNATRTTATVSVAQSRLPSTGLSLRLTSYNDNFSETRNCRDPSSTPNYVLFDWAEAVYTRTLSAQDNQQRFVTPAAGPRTVALSGHTGDSVRVYAPADGHRYAVALEGDTASVSVASASGATTHWAVGDDGYKRPASIEPDAPSNWSTPAAHGADYVLLTTEALLPAAQQLAAHRRSHDGYTVEVALVQNVFDEFDYGRPTPIAIRRFVRATQAWSPAPRFLSIFADAQYPIRDGSVETTHPAWSVPSFGYAPSDGWFAMQAGGPNDWSEVLAIGRIPVRSVAQGELFVDKLQAYETAPPARWPKRMLLLAGGTSEGEQNQLQFYSDRWGEIASDTVANVDGDPVPVHTGADTLQYYKKVNDALDASFQDSLAVDLQEGTGWLNYFGHSAAQTWEIVTDPPAEWQNAGRLPIAISLGCRTGSFAGGRFEQKSAPSLGEQIVVGSVRPDGTPRDGALNGGIAHFGESALGNLLPSARINDALVERVFVDTMRVLGTAIQKAKAEINDDFGNSDFYVKHLLQYGLLGDPATNIALPTRPDFHVAPSLISTTPATPVPSDELTVEVRLQNRGLIPRDSVTARLTWHRPDGTVARRTRRLDRFRLEKPLSFSFDLDERALGPNTFRVRVDPDNAYDEPNETDNTAEQTQVVFDTGVSLLAPPPFGTVATERPSLTFGISGASTREVPVVLQLDTVPDFSSPARREVRRDVSGLRGAWQPPALQPTQTYYWRARLANADATAWSDAQFTVAPSRPPSTWLQQRRLFEANPSTRLQRTASAWAFGTFPRTVRIRSNRGNASFVHGFTLDGTANYEYLQFGFGVLVVDGRTGTVKGSESFPTYDLQDQYEDDVGDGQAAIDALAAFLDETAQQGDYIFVRTRHLARQGGTVEIPDAVKSLFRTLGTSPTADAPHSTAIDTLTYNDLWTLKARKGLPAATVERARPDTNQIGQKERIRFSHASGTTRSTRIGPAGAWDTLQWSGTAPDSSDRIALQVLAADSTVLIDNLNGPSGTQDLSAIDAAAHPYLYLRATLSDSTVRTAPQLTQWSVSHTGVPELAVDPAGLAALPDTVRQGASVSAPVSVVNFGPVASAPVRLRVSVRNAANTTVPLLTDTLSALPPNGGRDTTTVSLSSTELAGSNVLTAEAQADGPPERLPSNNTAVRNLYVTRDDTPPSVRVLANGREVPTTPDNVGLQAPRLPFVSTEPTLEILVDDDNANLPLTDTSRVEVFLKGGAPVRTPSLGSLFERIPFTSEALTFVPPDSGSPKPLRLLYEPSLAARDSTYTLKVEAEDARGNSVEPYQGSFRVQQEQVIRDVYPYPNPMNTHTTFAFRVEGGANERLGDFSLRIYTLSGRLVRELEERHLDAPLRVGWNAVRWNGRDQDGDRVATGVYLYRVRIEGAETTFRGDIEKISVIR